MNARSATVFAAAAIAAIAAWPSFVATREARAAGPTPAPVLADYAQRERLVAFYEAAVRRRPDQIVTKLLAAQYVRRFREHGDPADLARAQHAAEASLAMQPRANAGAESVLASSLASLHRFREALVHAERALVLEPGNPSAAAQAASIRIELGDYPGARRQLAAARAWPNAGAALETAWARFDELTGDVAAARRAIDHALVQADSVMDNPAESRAWFHVRAGELAWTAGDGDVAERRFREALAIYPDDALAYNGLARMYWGERRWSAARDAATRAAALVPLPETLGYEADAQRALGDEAGARATGDLIAAIARIAGAARINDRALALYFADHRLQRDEAIRIARRDVAARDDAFAEDTLAWALARGGRRADARIAARKAVRWNTQDARLQYHAGVIAMESGDRDEATRRLTRALALNPQFHPVDADDARARLGRLAP